MRPTKEYAVSFTAPEQAELLSLEIAPRELNPNEVAGKTLATLISPGTEIAGLYRGLYQSISYPATPGYAAVFEVEESGANVTDIKSGDRVFCWGPHKSYQCKQRQEVLILPEGLSPEHACFARMMGISMTTLTTTKARPPEKVLVTGLGLVGHLAARIFANCGYEVIACDPLESRRDLAKRSGIERVYPSVPLEDLEIANHVGLVVECSGYEQAVLDGCRVVKKGGEVVLVGVPWEKRTNLSAYELLHSVFHRYAVVRSGWEWELPTWETDFRVNSILGNFEAALRWLGEGRIRVSGLYAKLPPREAQRAYQDLLHKRGNYLSVVFDWTDCP